jgi:hypothetical protein
VDDWIFLTGIGIGFGELIEGVGAGSCVFLIGTDEHLLHPLDRHFDDSGDPSRHFVIPSTQITPP